MKYKAKSESFLVAVRTITHWVLFATYVALFFTFPVTLFWGVEGTLAGLLLTIALLTYIRVRGANRICKRLNVYKLTKAEAPLLFALTCEYSRRLGATPPKLGIIESAMPNAAVFGFTKHDRWLVVTSGLLSQLKREELAAIIARLLISLSEGGVYCDSWLSQFLGFLDTFAFKRHSQSKTQNNYTFQEVMRQVLIFPLILFPVFALRIRLNHEELDLKAVSLSRRPNNYSEALRRIECCKNRMNFNAPFSCRHLFLLPPQSKETLAQLFFGHYSLDSRIKMIESMRKVINAI